MSQPLGSSKCSQLGWHMPMTDTLGGEGAAKAGESQIQVQRGELSELFSQKKKNQTGLEMQLSAKDLCSIPSNGWGTLPIILSLKVS